LSSDPECGVRVPVVFGARQRSQASLDLVPALFVIHSGPHHAGDVLGSLPLASSPIDLGRQLIIKDDMDSHAFNISRGEGHNCRRERVLATVWNAPESLARSIVTRTHSELPSLDPICVTAN
jgi:hypothetical protein